MTRRFRFPFGRVDVRRDLDDELAFHLEQRVRDLVRDGLTDRDARDRAGREFGDVGGVRAECLTIDERRERRGRRIETVGSLAQDLRFAVRAMRASPAFAVTAVLCVALGVAVTTTIFSAVNATLLRALPFRDADRLVAV